MTYSKTSVPVLRIDAQCSVIEAALKGYARWLSAPDSGQNVLYANLRTLYRIDHITGENTGNSQFEPSGLVRAIIDLNFRG